MKLLKYGAVLLLLISLWGCGKGNSATTGAAAIDPATGQHQVGMAVAGTGGAHVDAYFASASGYCFGCHGLPNDLAGGIAKVSCSTASRSGMACHPGTWPHPAGFNDPVVHGAKARATASSIAGMSSCKNANCHGGDYRGVGTAKDCIACHRLTKPATNAPHANNWLSGTFRHSGANDTNAAACAQCHLGGINTPTSNKQHTPPANTAPGCFNNTLCHLAGVHAMPYYAPADHGAAAKANIIGSCGGCHATGTPPRFNLPKGVVPLPGTSNLNVAAGCETCHNSPGLAHPQMWLPGRGAGTRQAFDPNLPATTRNTSHASAGLGTAGSNCTPCHGAGLAGGVGAIPSCMTASIPNMGCHATNPATNPTGCVSCHSVSPTGPNGSSAPNNDHLHSTHFAKIPGLAANTNCNTCHNLLTGPPLASHAVLANPVTNPTGNVVFEARFDNGGATHAIPYGTCSNVVCHGGKPTPAWSSGPNANYVVDPASFVPETAPGGSCLNCHTISTGTGFTLYTDVFNGNNFPNGLLGSGAGSVNLHDAHMQTFANGGAKATCIHCHDTGSLAGVHFQNLYQGTKTFADPQAKGWAKATIGGGTTFVNTYDQTIPTAPTCVGTSVTGSAFGCHSDARNWY